MKKAGLGIIFIAAAMVWVTPVFGQAGEQPTRPVDLDRPPASDLNPTDPLPKPILPTGTYLVDEMQLVGFSSRMFAGNEGVLSMSRACQREFAMSRICTVEEIRKSVNIPQPHGIGAAWVQDLDKASETPDMNCNGWMSKSSRDQGTSIDLGDCYGGIKMKSCDLQLAIACCSREVPVAGS